MEGVATWIKSTGFHRFMIENSWPFPAAETLHFMGLTLLFGALLAVDMRGLGFVRAIPLQAVHKLVPVALGAFTVNLLTGIAFLFADPDRYFINIAFQLKMALIVLAALNALAFEVFVFRPLSAGANVSETMAAKLTSGASIVIWALVIIAGRAIPYVEY